MIFNKTASWIEVFCAYSISNNIYPNEPLVVGDCSNEHLPDIYNIQKTLGIEIVQLEKDCDLDTKYVWNSYIEHDGNFEKIKEFCDSKYPNTYNLTEIDGKLGCFSTTEGAHSIDWMKEIYSKNLNNKLRKLNAGNYSGITKNIELCVSIIHRRKSLYDVLFILYLYLESAKQYENKFNKIIVITSTKLYVLEPHKVTNIHPIVYQGVICDFMVTGTDYLKTFDFDYNSSHKLTFTHFPNM